jgi:hypothetical protein
VASSTLDQPIVISGWGIDRRAPAGTGIDQVLVYANRLPDGGGAVGPLTFVGAAEYGLPRPDIANAFGPQFVNAVFASPLAG